MESGKFYFIKDEYYEKFSNCNIMGNKENDENGTHKRPCFYCFKFDGYYWMVPISSKVDKYTRIYEEKMEKYNGNYDGINLVMLMDKIGHFYYKTLFL